MYSVQEAVYRTVCSGEHVETIEVMMDVGIVLWPEFYRSPAVVDISACEELKNSLNQIKVGDSELFQIVLDAGLFPAAYIPFGVYLACKYRQGEVLQQLLGLVLSAECGIGALAVPSEAVWAAASRGFEDIVRILRVHNDLHGALMKAVQNQDMATACDLLKYGAEIQVDEKCALTVAVQNGDVLLAKKLLNSGADIDYRNSSALRAAIAAQSQRMVYFLLQNDAKTASLEPELLRSIEALKRQK